MSKPIALSAYERSLEKRYSLRQYFKKNDIYFKLVAEMRKTMDNNFHDISKADWAKTKFVLLVKAILGDSDELFEYVNRIYASSSGFKNIPKEDWKNICSIASKIVVNMGWDYDTKR